MGKYKPGRDRSCSRKQRYETKKDASKAAQALFKYRFSKVHVYSCKFCGGFHVGHYPNFGRKPRRKR